MTGDEQPLDMPVYWCDGERWHRKWCSWPPGEPSDDPLVWSLTEAPRPSFIRRVWWCIVALIRRDDWRLQWKLSGKRFPLFHVMNDGSQLVSLHDYDDGTTEWHRICGPDGE